MCVTLSRRTCCITMDDRVCFESALRINFAMAFGSPHLLFLQQKKPFLRTCCSIFHFWQDIYAQPHISAHSPHFRIMSTVEKLPSGRMRCTFFNFNFNFDAKYFLLRSDDNQSFSTHRRMLHHSTQLHRKSTRKAFAMGCKKKILSLAQKLRGVFIVVVVVFHAHARKAWRKWNVHHNKLWMKRLKLIIIKWFVLIFCSTKLRLCVLHILSWRGVGRRVFGTNVKEEWKERKKKTIWNTWLTVLQHRMNNNKLFMRFWINQKWRHSMSKCVSSEPNQSTTGEAVQVNSAF